MRGKAAYAVAPGEGEWNPSTGKPGCEETGGQTSAGPCGPQEGGHSKHTGGLALHRLCGSFSRSLSPTSSDG